MGAIWQKIVADLFGRRAISILITITILIASALLTLALSTLMNLGGPYDKLFSELNSAHLWLLFKPERVGLADIHRIESLSGVAASTGRRYSYVTQIRYNNERLAVSLRVEHLERPAVHRLLLTDGHYLSSNVDGVLVERFLVENYKVSVGDHLIITDSTGTEISLPVIGIAYDPMYDTYRSNQPPYVFLSEETLQKLFPDKDVWDTSLGLRLTNPEAVDTVLAEIESMRSTDFITSYTDWHDAKESSIFRAQLTFVFLTAFSLFAIFATVLIVVSVVSSTVLSQIRQIGVLKAIGFTGSQVSLLYIGQYAILSILGTALGFLCGLALAPLPLQTVTASLGTNFHPPFSPLLMGLVFLIIPGVTMLAAALAARRGAKANIIKAIAVGAEAPIRKSFWGARFAEWLGAPMSLVLGLNDAFVRPLRALLTGLNLTLGVMGIVFGLALSNTLQTYRENPALLGMVYDATVTRQQNTDARTRRILSQAPGVGAFYGETQLQVQTLNGRTFQLRAVDGDLGAFPFHIAEGRFFQPDSNEAVVGRGLLDWLGLELGDNLTLTLENEDRHEVTWTIVGVYPEPADAGQRMMVTLSSASSLDRHAAPDTYYLKLSPDANTDKLREYLEPNKESDLSLILVDEAIPSSVIYLQLAVFMLGGILIGIAVINVFITSLLATQEKLRVVGVLKTIGMVPAQVVTMINTAAGALGLLAVLIGIPLGLALTGGMLTALSNVYGFGQVSLSFNLGIVLLLIPLVMIVSLAGSYLPARWAARLSIVRVLREE
ncbi:MAG: ABC transporter permease [Anaerolineales bacterium]|jgi:putative ABC transport system permease protein